MPQASAEEGVPLAVAEPRADLHRIEPNPRPRWRCAIEFVSLYPIYLMCTTAAPFAVLFPIFKASADAGIVFGILMGGFHLGLFPNITACFFQALRRDATARQFYTITIFAILALAGYLVYVPGLLYCKYASQLHHDVSQVVYHPPLYKAGSSLSTNDSLWAIESDLVNRSKFVRPAQTVGLLAFALGESHVALVVETAENPGEFVLPLQKDGLLWAVRPEDRVWRASLSWIKVEFERVYPGSTNITQFVMPTGLWDHYTDRKELCQSLTTAWITLTGVAYAFMFTVQVVNVFFDWGCR